MKISRRDTLFSILAAGGAAGLGGCASLKDSRADLKPLGGRGLIVVRDGETVLNRVEGYASGLDKSETAPRRRFTLGSPFRAASMSKVVVALTARAMSKAGILNLEDDVSSALGLKLRHPQYPAEMITLEKLLSHQSGISDPDVYWTVPVGDIRSLLSDDMFKGGRPGLWFEYANINYGIAATVMEARSGLRLDQLTRKYVLGPLGLDAGFNWAGVSAAKRQLGATLYREIDGEMRIQTDGPKALASTGPVLYGDDPDFVFDAYTPGTNGTLLSPQGGLRASLSDLLIIAKAIGDAPDLHKATWRYDGQNGAGGDGHFVSFGPGLYVYPPDLSPIPGQLMVGHHGEAYGLYGGLWHLPQINAQIVHAVTATPSPPKPYDTRLPAMAPESRYLLDEAVKVLKLG
ncbi:MAG: serine hydrolase domain-containing protein [Hellea sp.]